MNNAIDRINLDVRSETSQIALFWKKGDTARVIEAALFERNKPYSLSGCTVIFTAPKTEDMNLFNECDIKDNRIIYKVTPGTTDTVSTLPCEFRVIGDDGNVLTSPKFTINVIDTVIDPEKDVAPSGEATALDRLISDASELIDEVEAKLENGEFNGKPGDPFRYEDFTPEQLDELKGVGISSIAHTGIATAKNPVNGITNSDFVSDLYTITYTDGNKFELQIPRGSRIYSGAYGGPGVNIGKNDGIILELAAGKGDYFFAKTTGNLWRKASDSEQIWEYITCLKSGGDGGVDLSDADPLPDGKASSGTSDKAARADHRHPRTGMPPVNDIGVVDTVDNPDTFILHSTLTEAMGQIKWSRLRSIIKEFVDKNISAISLVDSDSGYEAVLPKLTEDSVIALTNDIKEALSDYYAGSIIDGKIDDIYAYAQKKGDYVLSADLAAHNISPDAHNDIRLLLSGLESRLNALADSDDTTLDQLSELVAYIKANRGLIESVTTSKVNVSDVVNNLATNVSDKPLSAAQGVALKALIDAITVPTKLSELSEDSTHRLVTDTEKTAWNSKSNFSGSYADLSGKPTIPSKPSDIGAQPAGNYVPSEKTITITGIDEYGDTHTWTVYGVKS